MYRCCLLVGLPRFFYLGNSLQSPKFFLLLRPPPPLEPRPEGWITRGRPNSPRRRLRPSNNGRHNRPKHKGAGKKFLFPGRHHVPHIPGRLDRPMYGHIAQRRVSRVSPKGQEITQGVQGPRSVNHIQVKLREQLMPRRLAWRGSPNGCEVLYSRIFKATGAYGPPLACSPPNHAILEVPPLWRSILVPAGSNSICCPTIYGRKRQGGVEHHPDLPVAGPPPPPSY